MGNLMRYRFKTKSVDDYRPLIDMADIQMPWWCTTYGVEYVTIVCYLPKEEDLLKYCLDTMIKNYKVSFSEGVLDIFDSAEAYVEFLKKCSFETVIPSVIGGELIGALNVNPASNENVIKGFSNGFDKANLRIKLQSLIICVYLNNDCKKLLLDNYKNLFIIISEIMYMDRLHQQNHIFDKEKATIIVNDVIDLTSKLINDEKVLDLEL